MGVLLATTLAASLASGSTCGLPPADATPWTAPEALTYEVRASGAPGRGTATLRVAEGGDRLFLTGSAAMDLVFGLYSARGSARAFLDAASLRPQRYDDQVDDRSGRGTSSVRFTRSAATRIEWTNQGRKGVNAFLHQPAVLDALSAVYRLRATPLAEGDALCFDLVGGRFAWRVTATVRADRVTAPAGTFRAWRIDGRATRTDRPSEAVRLTLWVSDDARRLPVRAEIGARAGSVEALLSRAGPG